MQAFDRQRVALRVSRISITWNILLTLFKLVAGITAHSGALLSDAVESATDIFSTMVMLAGIRASSRERDLEHPYGHERLESVSSVVLAVVLAVTGAAIGVGAVRSILRGLNEGFAVPGVLALVAAATAIVSKEILFRYIRRQATAIRSTSLMADAWHHRSDALSSIGTLVGVGGAMLGYPILDPIVAAAISVLIIKVALGIARQAFDQMIDRSCSPDIEQSLLETAQSIPGVQTVDSLTTRQFGARYYVDIAIAADATLTVAEGHDIANAVHSEIERRFPDVKHCMVHVNPYPSPQGHH